MRVKVIALAGVVGVFCLGLKRITDEYGYTNSCWPLAVRCSRGGVWWKVRGVKADANYKSVRIYKWLTAVRNEGRSRRYLVKGNGVWLR